MGVALFPGLYQAILQLDESVGRDKAM